MVKAFRCTCGKRCLRPRSISQYQSSVSSGMQPADDVELGDGLAPAFAGALPHLFERHGVGLGIAHALAESAQAATGHAHIGGVDVAVDVEVGDVAVQALPHQVGQVAERQDIGGAVERQAVVERKPLAGFHLSANGIKTAIVNYHLHVQAPGLRRRISAAQNKKNNTLT